MAVETLTEELAANLEEAAEATRRINTTSVSFFLGGVGVGVAIGFFFGYRWNKEKLRMEAFKESEAEVEKIREIFQQKTVAAQPKPTVDEVMEEKGYTTPPIPEEVLQRPLRPPVPVQEPPVVPQKHVDVWNHKEELASRDPEEPYIIHQTEFKNSETGYTQVTFTYWTVDDVLSDAENKPLHEMDGLVGADNLKWGHGSDDIDVVFVRNDELELEMEICRVYRSFGEEVMGIGVDPEDDSEIEHSSYPRKKTRKRRD